MTRVALLWHMHQPYYEDLVTGEHMLPWVRLHALKDYYGMAALLREFPDIRVTFNLVPSLLVQIEAFAADRARDRFLELSLCPAHELTGADRSFVVRNFFHAQRQRMIDIYPRYAELAILRGDGPIDERRAEEIGARFGVDDLRDLQVWHKLAWIDPFYLDGDSRIRALVDKGRSYTEEDKIALRQVEIELLNAVIPTYRALAAAGQIELSTSPFYHPILPLLCDTDIYHRTHPDAPDPRRHFAHPEDAREQLQRAVACHERLFGARPVGVWPSEGSVSPAMVPLVADAGLTWMATDEMILARTLGTSFSRDHDGQLQAPELLYRPYVVESNGARVACVFRDHALSDLIGFVYSGWPAERAADDFVEKLAAAGRGFSDRTGGEEALIPVILDGENAWEHFPAGGRAFLRALYGRLSSHPELETVTMAQGCAAASTVLPDIFPGSWIDGNFYIWIGHADDRTAWSQLADARDALEGAENIPEDALTRARQEVLIAEGSDWFWWYGDDHSSEHDLEFDDLFRRHLRNAYRLIDRTPPDELLTSNISTGIPSAPVIEPSALIGPTLDGEETSYFEWLGAGRYDVRDVAGAMHQIGRSAPSFDAVFFGFDDSHLYLRLDATRHFIEVLEDGRRCVIRFLEPDGLAITVSLEGGEVCVVADPPMASGLSASANAVLELAVPLEGLRHADGALPVELRFFVSLEEGSEEIERHPMHRPFTLAVPDGRFRALHWRV